MTLAPSTRAGSSVVVERNAQRGTDPRSGTRRTAFVVAAFGLTFVLLMTDYIARQMLSASFPSLKSDWNLLDSELASLTSAAALAVGVLALPLSVLADRWGRIRCLILMSAVWCTATLFSAIAVNYEQLLLARFLAGAGEAASGSVGIAIVLSVFAPRWYSAVSGAFMSAGSFGSVIGVTLGGVIAVNYGWRYSFYGMGLVGVVLTVVFWSVITERRVSRYAAVDDETSTSNPAPIKVPVSSLFTNRTVWFAYIGSGLQMFTAAVLLTWLPSFFNRYYGMPADSAGAATGLVILLVGAGMVLGGIVTDRLCRSNPARRWLVAAAFCAISLVSLGIGFGLETGVAQLALLGVGALFSASCSGPTAAMVAGLTHRTLHASSLGTLTVANNIIGFTSGPLLVGFAADRIGLAPAMQLGAAAYALAIAVLLMGKRYHWVGLHTLAEVTARATARAEESARPTAH